MTGSEGQFTDLFSYTSLVITKKSHTKSQEKSQNHQKNHIKKAPKSQVNEKLLKNHRKKSLEITKITKNRRKKSCDFKITKITYAILRSDLPLDREHRFQIFKKLGVKFYDLLL